MPPATFTLFHYPLSPFSEKMRAMLGYAELPWQSVAVREMPPRPVLAALAGGYRKVPVAQLGADVFCDTHLIASEVAALSGKPLLAVEQCSPEVQAFIRDTDMAVFLTCLMAGSGGGLLMKLVKSTSVLDTLKFLADRIAMGRKARVKAPSPRSARASLTKHLQGLEARLVGQPFLFGTEPCHGDFSAYHSLWFVVDLAEKPLLVDFPGVRAWYQRMHSFSQADVTPLSASQALANASEAQPRPLPANANDNLLLGQEVSLAPVDYGRDPVYGVLVAETADRWIVARQDAQVGTVHLHFPRHGFRVRAR
ncbi:MAG: glutathione S-transferase family protein [Marinobacter sp.]|nr:glutathione S-transferase family protein [Marinobacter sp.]